VGLPTALRARTQLRADQRDTRSLVNPRTRPTLVGFAIAVVPFLGLVTLFASSEWQDSATLPFGLAGLALACVTWVRDAGLPRDRVSSTA